MPTLDIPTIDKKPYDFVIFLCCYNDATVELATKYATKYGYFRVHMLEQNHWQENNLWFYLRDHPKEIEGKKFVGSLAASFHRKIPFFDFEQIVNRNKDAEFMFMMGGPTIIYEANKWWKHPHLISILYCFMKKTGIDVKWLTKVISMVFCNYVILAPHVLNEWTKLLCKIKRISEDTRNVNLRRFLWSDSLYQWGLVSKAELVEKYGVPWYPHHCFVIERLIGLWAASRGWKIRNCSSRSLWRKKTL